jgi:hypothetical protein
VNSLKDALLKAGIVTSEAIKASEQKDDKLRENIKKEQLKKISASYEK